MAGRCHLRPGLLIWQVAADVGCRCIELQSLQRKILEIGHGDGGSVGHYIAPV